MAYQYEVGTTDISGFVDFAISDPETGISTILEMKAVNELKIEHIL